MVPRSAEAVVFSIDGSFLAAYSLRAIDPKIRGGAVDVVRWVFSCLIKVNVAEFLFWYLLHFK